MARDLHLYSDADEVARIKDTMTEHLTRVSRLPATKARQAADVAFQAFVTACYGCRVYVAQGMVGIDPAIRSAMERAVLDGETDTAIADRYNLDRSTFWRLRQRMRDAPALEILANPRSQGFP